MLSLLDFLFQKKRVDEHFKHCSGTPGITNKFENQNLATFEDS